MNVKKWKRVSTMAAIATTLSVGTADAQVFTPTYMAPRSSSDLGLYLSDGPGDFAVEGIWRQASGGYDLGLRLGVADLGDAALLIGGELRNPLAVGTAPLDLAFTAGAQGIIGDLDAVGLQLGLSVGHTFASPGLAITPYLHPRLALVDGFGRDDDLDLELLADLGVDLRFSPTLSLRLGVAFEDVGADWGIGFAWR